VPIDPLSDAKIIDSWHANAAPWTGAVRDGQIESRTLVTDQAILSAVLSRAPRSALDLGCGEGWLVRALAALGVQAAGVDVVPALIDAATLAGGGDFRVASFEDIAAGVLRLTTDVVVANFALLGKESVERVIQHVPALLNAGGALVVQTLHPIVACGDNAYEDGWRAGTWAGFSANFTDPAPWYFRTIQSWIELFTTGGLRLREIREPVHPVTRKPASIIFIAEVSG
jgi:2-polyprenyl-3-methyl-5-hydroxy-6-metoxy-1,4-benzoquinol methylase